MSTNNNNTNQQEQQPSLSSSVLSSTTPNLNSSKTPPIPLKKKLIDEITILIGEIRECYTKNIRAIMKLRKANIKEDLPKEDRDLKEFLEQAIKQNLNINTVNELQRFKTRALYFFDNVMNDSQTLERLKTKYEILEEINNSISKSYCDLNTHNLKQNSSYQYHRVKNSNDSNNNNHTQKNQRVNESAIAKYSTVNITMDAAYNNPKIHKTFLATTGATIGSESGWRTPTIKVTTPKNELLTPGKLELDISKIVPKEEDLDYDDVTKKTLGSRRASGLFTPADKEIPWHNLSPISKANHIDFPKIRISPHHNTAITTTTSMGDNMNYMILNTKENMNNLKPSIRYETNTNCENSFELNQYMIPIKKKGMNIKKKLPKSNNNNDHIELLYGDKSNNLDENQISFSIDRGQNIKISPKIIKEISIDKTAQDNDTIEIHEDLITKLTSLDKLNHNIEKFTVSRDDSLIDNNILDIEHIKNIKENAKAKTKNNHILWRFIIRLEDILIDMHENYKRFCQNLYNDLEHQARLVQTLLREQNSKEIFQEIESYKDLRLRHAPQELIQYLKIHRGQIVSTPISPRPLEISTSGSPVMLLGVDDMLNNSFNAGYNDNNNDLSFKIRTNSINANDNQILSMDQKNLTLLVNNMKNTINTLKESNLLLNSEKEKLLETNKLLELKIKALMTENEKLTKTKSDINTEFENQQKVIDYEKKKIELQKNMLVLEKQNLEYTRKELEHLKELLLIKEMECKGVKTERKDILTSKIRVSQVSLFTEEDDDEDT